MAKLPTLKNLFYKARAMTRDEIEEKFMRSMDDETREMRRKLDEQMQQAVEAHWRRHQAELRDRAVPRSDTPPVTELPGQGRCVGYVIAKRAWQLDLVGGLLKSQHETTWLPGEPVRAEEPGIPTMGGYGAGIYGMKLDQPQEFPTFTGRGSDMLAYGLVALWGRIKEHAKGYRAEWAYPLELKRLNMEGPFHDALLAALNERYGCRPHKEEATCQLTDPRDALTQWQQAASLALSGGISNHPSAFWQHNPFNSNTGGP